MQYSKFMRPIFHIAPTFFGAIISSSSGTWHRNFFTTYSNKIGHTKRKYLVVPTVQNFTDFGYNNIQSIHSRGSKKQPNEANNAHNFKLFSNFNEVQAYSLMTIC